ncbi:MAG TPA: ATP-dependent DNA helicase [Patescibacteria group bacterium]|nr:ATP-dependent DNA helicase [Patescibacteria group bacterium]
MPGEFVSSYKKLNTKQKLAVDTIDGPLLVIAGPGTGKTEILSLRVANILVKTDINPENVVCLTFTNKATNNMRERLAKLIGPTAYKVNVKTFHSFSSEIIQEYPEYFWNGASFSILPDTLQLDIISSILDELPFKSPLASKFEGRYTSLKNVKDALKLAKDAGLTPEKLQLMIETNLKYIDEIEPKIIKLLNKRLSFKNLDDLSQDISKLPGQNIDQIISPLVSLSTKIIQSLELAIVKDKLESKLKYVSKWKAKWLQNINSSPGMYLERKYNLWWHELAKIYSAYRKKLHSNFYYDYSDMIVEVISQLENNPELLTLIQEKYNYILIDEFQDTTAAQFRLALICSSNYASQGSPNLMAVGDDDQTIYAFNGADLNNMFSLINLYPKTKIILLKENYRSTQPILDQSQKIIKNSSTRIIDRLEGLNKNLISTLKSNTSNIVNYSYPTKDHQIFEISQKIKAIKAINKVDSIAVLARSHNSLVDLSNQLQKQGVAVAYERQNNILENEPIVQIILLANILENIKLGQDININFNLSKLLCFAPWKLDSIDFWKLSINSSEKGINWLELMLKGKSVKLKNYAKWLIWLSSKSETENIQVMIEYLFGLRASKYLTSPIYEYYFNKSNLDSDYLQSLSAIKILLKLLSEHSNINIGQSKLSDFIHFIQINQETGQMITDKSWYASNKDAVSLMTVHGAKGLEFDHVFLIDAIDKEWRPRIKRFNSPANLPLQPYGEDNEDYIRLAYVAATRAKQSFIVSGYKYNDLGEELMLSPLFGSLAKVDIEEKQNIQSKITILENSLTKDVFISKNIKELLKPRLARLSLSPTGYNNYLDIVNNGPTKFFEKNILALPEAKIPHLAYGVAIHSALEQAQHLVNQTKLSVLDIQRSFESTLRKQYLDVADELRYLNQGEVLLNKLFKTFEYTPKKGALAEFLISNIRLPDGAVIGGKLDNIYKEGKNLIISDYKTGKALSSFTSHAKDKAIKIWQHKNQQVFYCLLLKNTNRFKDIQNISSQIIYLEAENKNDLILSFTPSEDELERMQILINVIYRNVINLVDIDTSNYPKTINGIRNFEEDLIKKY